MPPEDTNTTQSSASGGVQADTLPQVNTTDGAGGSAKKSRDWWDRLGPLTTFIASVVIGGAGVLATHIYNEGQLSLKKEEIAGQLELKRREIDGELSLKEREESRHTKIDLTEALDKYAHYMFSSDPQQREFGYNLFTQLGFADIALKIGQTTADQAIRKVAESQISSPDASIRTEATRTLAILTSGQRDTIRKFINIAEGTKYDTVYQDSSELVFGIHPWALGSGDLYKVLAAYVAQPGAAHKQELTRFLDRAKAGDKTLASDPLFVTSLKVVGGDSVMQGVEDEFVNKDLDISLSVAAQYSLRLPLSIAILHDTRVNLGPRLVAQFANESTDALGGSPANGVSEKAWISRFLDRRLNYLRQRFPDNAGLQARVQRYSNLISNGDWQLEGASARTASTGQTEASSP